MDWSGILTFAFVALLLVMSPGPNGVLVAKTVPTSGRGAGFANVAGIVLGFYLHGGLSILGISVLLVQSAIAFSVVKYLGAAYLGWIGIKALIAAWRGVKSDAPTGPARTTRTLRAALLEGFLTNALNPKVSMFYLAAFPQFIALGETPATASLVLVVLHSLIAAVWFGAMVVLFDGLSGLTRRGTFQRWLKGVTGVIFISFAAKLATIRATP